MPVTPQTAGALIPDIYARRAKKRREQPRPTNLGIVGPDLPKRDPAFQGRVKLEEKAFLKKGSQRGPGTYTARQTGARGLAVRHFEEVVRSMQQDVKRKKARAMI